MIAALVDRLGDAGEIQLDVDHFPATIGRKAESTVRLTDRWVSRLHCRIEIEGEDLVVRDLGSRHGTYVNGELVEDAVLAPGDELQIGLHEFRIKYVRAEPIRGSS